MFPKGLYARLRMHSIHSKLNQLVATVVLLYNKTILPEYVEINFQCSTYFVSIFDVGLKIEALLRRNKSHGF